MSNTRTPLVAGNWKMNGNQELIDSFAQHFGSLNYSQIEQVVCPPAVFLSGAKATLANLGFAISAQTVSELEEGAHTGDISCQMLTSVGCQFCIVGHSERRTDHHETSEVVATKALALLNAGITPIFCVGEPLSIREAGGEKEFVKQQLDALFAVVSPAQLSTVVIAYEPIWAIGTGVTASPQQAQDMHAYIRAELKAVSEDAANNVRLLYGGSVKPDNAEELFGQTDIDGGLIGGASLKPEDFSAICAAANA